MHESISLHAFLMVDVKDGGLGKIFLLYQLILFCPTGVWDGDCIRATIGQEL